MYDYGIINNYFRYRRATPPVYNLANVVVPVFMLYGKNDVLAAPEVNWFWAITIFISMISMPIIYSSSIGLLRIGEDTEKCKGRERVAWEIHSFRLCME